MAQIKHNHFLDTVDKVITEAKAEGIVHLRAEDKRFTGRVLTVKGKACYHFGNTGYLGLEQDSRLKTGAMQAILRYGTQFPLSKTYISHPLYEELEEKLELLFENPVIITKNSTLGHLAVIPTVVRDEDAVILDHQVHWSVQNAAQLLKVRGIPVQLIRHNNLDFLESLIQKLSSKVSKIWYMADGVYSMFGDYAPVKELLELSRKYPQLHLYFDDVHGMSWRGRHGMGYVMSQLETLPENVLVFGTLSKTFGASGSVLVCSNKKFYHQIKNFGGPLTFSAQLEPSAVGAAIASAKIHLSDEIYCLQDALKSRIDYFNQQLAEAHLPLIARNSSPVFYIGTGLPASGYFLVKRLMEEGIYVNLGLFPAVPAKNTGLRITLSNHNAFDDIDHLVVQLLTHYDFALMATHNSRSRVGKAFRMDFKDPKPFANSNYELQLQEFETIADTDYYHWNSNIGRTNMLDQEGLRFLEESFKQVKEREHNWRFKYVQIVDDANCPVLMTFLTESLWKNDMLAPASVSRELEKQREAEPYLQTSRVLSLGSLFTEGNHLYLNEEHPQVELALTQLLEYIENLAHDWKVSMTVLRDFDLNYKWSKIIQDQGYIPIDMPESCVLQDLHDKMGEDYFHYLSKRSQKHFKKDIEPYLNLVTCRVLKRVSSKNIKRYYDLYLQVKAKNYGLNTFTYPPEVFEAMRTHPNWEFIVLKAVDDGRLLGIMFCYINYSGTYIPSLIGMDYRYLNGFQTYRQLLYQSILRARKLYMKRIDFGMSANFEKRKLGASLIPKQAFVQTDDNFLLEQLEMMRTTR
ncbi:aminotransferase class I/II-fold pyridoxal phosphate-dependent enzyme [Leeuwenhoekiella parthenopeia]|uniref:Bifunctional aminotransferase class I/II-fold pyridoxal phosphate-dependent enzyme/GNAT family N-acetyltransferase n=1 Tax=Leeuwenhoekiella parthenopeia TaxID=2890320 RepID=A0ABS8GW48_9FLAO|nr:aminotransferase class I/II-fold pyridoxal phosphate-dependent enzyme [Leeuwenhoekiella parthenopeia]MCC4214230.1 bifunctional aminotransferase class I/II-fold pyridoxal phosphate-dependent enzyme/GNAT family N-acetyltransferase [Leeuwenhoekiella parthenopeia]